jgi:hypothetical protein
MNTQQNRYEIHFKNGGKTTLAGRNITEAYSQTGERTADGNIDFSLLDWYINMAMLPIGIKPEVPGYQIYVMKDKESQFEKWGTEFEEYNDMVESLMHIQVKRMGNYSAMILNTLTEKPVSWLYTGIGK